PAGRGRVVVLTPDGTVLVPEIRMSVHVEVAEPGVRFPLEHALHESLKARVRDVVVPAQNHGKPAPFHDPGDTVHDGPGRLHDVRGIDVEVADIDDLRVVSEAQREVRDDVHCRVICGSGINSAGGYGSLASRRSYDTCS